MSSRAKFCLRCGAPLAIVNDGERDRLKCERDGCGFTFYDNPLPVVAAIVEHQIEGEAEGHVILVRQHGWPAGWVGLVTGFLERGEEPAEGLVREVKEELGLDAEIVELVGVYGFAQRNEVIAAWHVRARGEIVLGAELESMKRVAISKLRPWPFATGDAVRDWLAKRRG